MNANSKAAGIGLALAAGLLVLGAARPGNTEEGDYPSTPPPPGAKVLFDGKSLDGWEKRGGGPAPFKIENGAAEAAGGDIQTKEHFRDCQVHVEFMEPLMADKSGQARGNSGVYLQSRYEVQVLDSYGKAHPGTGDCGAIYEQSAPLANACRPPLKWQAYDIIYRAPRFVDGKMAEKPRITVWHNGILIQNNFEIQGVTRAGVTGEDPNTPGALMLQFHGCPVKYRSVWLIPLPEKTNPNYE